MSAKAMPTKTETAPKAPAKTSSASKKLAEGRLYVYNGESVKYSANFYLKGRCTNRKGDILGFVDITCADKVWRSSGSGLPRGKALRLQELKTALINKGSKDALEELAEFFRNQGYTVDSHWWIPGDAGDDTMIRVDGVTPVVSATLLDF
jgi:hypothetical protein